MRSSIPVGEVSGSRSSALRNGVKFVQFDWLCSILLDVNDVKEHFCTHNVCLFFLFSLLNDVY